VEYLIGAFTTLLAVIVANRFIKKELSEESNLFIRYSQSHVYNLIQPALDYMPITKIFKESQARKHLASLYIKVMIVGGEAYWIKDHALYTASLVDGEVDKNTTQKVDTMSMDKVQLEKTMFIVEKLREDKRDDSGSPGEPKFR